MPLINSDWETEYIKFLPYQIYGETLGTIQPGKGVFQPCKHFFLEWKFWIFSEYINLFCLTWDIEECIIP